MAELTDTNIYGKLKVNGKVTVNDDLDVNGDIHISGATILTGQTVAGNIGDLVYLSGANTWAVADASAATTSNGMLGINKSSTEVYVRGIYTTTGLTAGAIYYISETAGAITSTAPTTSLSIVRLIGYALSTTQLFIDPDKTWVENA